MHRHHRTAFVSTFVTALTVALGLAAGCATPGHEGEPADRGQAVFYPPAPAEPRLQYLAHFAAATDVAAGAGDAGRLRDWLFGREGAAEQVVNKPYGLALHDGAIYVVDTRGPGYTVFDLRAHRVRTVHGAGAGAMVKPVNITIDADGTRYVTDTQRDAILVFDRDDRFVRVLGRPGQFRPVDVAIAGERLYVTDILHHQVQVLDKRDGALRFTFGEAGSAQGQFYHPTSLALGPDGTVYVTDTTNFRIQQFTADGEFIRALGQIGLNPGQFARPKGLALDREQRIYVVDAAFENVQLLDADGRALTFFGGAGDGPGNLNLPTVVKVDYDNVPYFQPFAAPGFRIEYLVLVASQFGPNKVAVYGFGVMGSDAGGRDVPRGGGPDAS